jgi:hypothetical protein
MKLCWEHKDCNPDQKCVNGYCGEPRYFQALASLDCKSDDLCKVRHHQLKV